jgi:hypothetical protein
MVEGLGQNDRISLELYDTFFDNRFAYQHPHQTFRRFRAREFIRGVENELQSFMAVNLDTTLVYIKYSRALRGGAYALTLSFDDFVDRKTSIIKVVTRGGRNDCFYQCAVIGQAKLNGDSSLNLLRNQKQREVRGNALRLALGGAFGVYIALDDIPAYEVHLQININVISFQSLTFLRKSTVFPKSMFLLYHDNHFHYVNHTHVGSLWNQRHFCYKCMSAYANFSHACVDKCLACRHPSCGGVGGAREDMPRQCPDCNGRYFNAECFARHKRTLCHKEYQCKECGTYVKRTNEHVCYQIVCSNCGEHADIREKHLCYHQEMKEVPDVGEKYIFYDYECTLDEDGHNVALVVAMTMESDEPHIFEDHDEFIKWLFMHRGYTCIAHNCGRYDFHFIKREMLRRGIRSNDVVNGNTVFYSNVKTFKIRMIDSVRFIPLALRKFPKTFGITELSKGFFPYRFFTKANKHYKGPIPPIEYYEFDRMSPEGKKAGMEWYAKQDQVDLWEMCKQYCISDVALLREGCLRFRQLFLDITHQVIDPFQFITIASVCMAIYKRFFMPSETIGVLERVKDSSYETEYQQLVGGLFGYCRDVGCPQCTYRYSRHPDNFMLMHQLFYRFTQEGKQHNNVMRECQWERERTKYDLSTVDYTRLPLQMRDAFFGGRTEPFKLYRKIRPGEKIRYLDFTSLYPSVQYGIHNPLVPNGERRILRYPVGHPIRITHDIGPLEQYFGFVKCFIIPPKDLYIPLLPEKRDGKLIFDLQPKMGTWTTIEVLKAVELGYRIGEIYEIVHFPESTDTLFREYVKMFLKIKQESAGWEKLGLEHASNEEKMEFLSMYELAQGVRLETMENNPGMYFIAKSCLNSLWGKFGQRDEFTNCVDVFDHETFAKYAHNDNYEVSNVFMHDNQARTITYKKRGSRAHGKNTNIAIAAFTTSYARLRLYDALEVLGERVLYMDTDSVIFVDDGVDILCTPYLGDLTDELDTGDYIEEFVATGPKCYAYRTHFGKSECKIKGFTLNVETGAQLNFQTLKRIVTEDHAHSVEVTPLQFVIGEDHSIQTNTQARKRFRLTFDKRYVDWLGATTHEINTKPFY